MTGSALMTTREVLAVIGGALDRVEPDRSGLGDAERLELVALAGVVAGRVEALRCALVAEADAAESSMRAKGTPSSSWLALSGTLSRKESAGLLYRARDVAADPLVQREALAGRVSVEQARSISRVLRELPVALSEAQRQQAAGALVGYAGRVDATRLAGMGSEVLGEVAPELEVQAEGERLARQAEKARRERSLWFVRDPGSVRFRGSLPIADAEGWVAIIDAHVESQRRNALEARDRLAESPTPEQRRADALVAMIRDHSDRRLAPSGGGDRPRIVVTLDYDALVSGAVGSGLLASGQRIGAGEVRRLCCDADLVPVVLGSASEVLDVGRVRRLVTRGVRIALTHRDGGCVFPACDTHPTACEAHHIDITSFPGGPGVRRVCRILCCCAITTTLWWSPTVTVCAISGRFGSVRTGSRSVCRPAVSTPSGSPCATSASRGGTGLGAAGRRTRSHPRCQPHHDSRRRPYRDSNSYPHDCHSHRQEWQSRLDSQAERARARPGLGEPGRTGMEAVGSTSPSLCSARVAAPTAGGGRPGRCGVGGSDLDSALRPDHPRQ